VAVAVPCTCPNYKMPSPGCKESTCRPDALSRQPCSIISCSRSIIFGNNVPGKGKYVSSGEKNKTRAVNKVTSRG